MKLANCKTTGAKIVFLVSTRLSLFLYFITHLKGFLEKSQHRPIAGSVYLQQ